MGKRGRGRGRLEGWKVVEREGGRKREREGREGGQNAHCLQFRFYTELSLYNALVETTF